MPQNNNISLSLGNKIDILNKTQSLDARYGVYDTRAEALLIMQSYGADGRQVAVYTDKPNGKVEILLYNEALDQLDPIGAIDKHFEWALDFLSFQILDTFSPYPKFTIESIEDIHGTPITTIEVNGVPFNLGDPIEKGDSFKVEVDQPSIILLNCLEL